MAAQASSRHRLAQRESRLPVHASAQQAMAAPRPPENRPDSPASVRSAQTPASRSQARGLRAPARDGTRVRKRDPPARSSRAGVGVFSVCSGIAADLVLQAKPRQSAAVAVKGGGGRVCGGCAPARTSGARLAAVTRIRRVPQRSNARRSSTRRAHSASSSSGSRTRHDASPARSAEPSLDPSQPNLARSLERYRHDAVPTVDRSEESRPVYRARVQTLNYDLTGAERGTRVRSVLGDPECVPTPADRNKGRARRCLWRRAEGTLTAPGEATPDSFPPAHGTRPSWMSAVSTSPLRTCEAGIGSA